MTPTSGLIGYDNTLSINSICYGGCGGPNGMTEGYCFQHLHGRAANESSKD